MTIPESICVPLWPFKYLAMGMAGAILFKVLARIEDCVLADEVETEKE